MNRKVLIISPYFPPSNAADMQRIRMSLPYFEQFGWDAEVIAVNQDYSDMVKDELLMQSITANIKIHYVEAFDKKWTSKLGLGSLALRSFLCYLQKVNQILKAEKFDLIYFSTTQFPVCVLGAYWKRRFGVPYVIDMQDPWHSDYYRNKPKEQQPPKYWFSYRINKYLEPIAIKYADGLISVSEDYITTLLWRYPQIRNIPSSVITFAAFEKDLAIAACNKQLFRSLLEPDKINIVYVGRGGNDMHTAIRPVFEALQSRLQAEPERFRKLKFYFIGTSYAPAGSGRATILPLARKYNVEEQVIEITDRISFYQSLFTLQQADALFIPGSDDPQYTASKIYPYLLLRKPLLAIFHQNSSVVDVIDKCTVNAALIKFSDKNIINKLEQVMTSWANNVLPELELTEFMNDHSAESMTLKQVELFNTVVDKKTVDQ